jgi:glutamyl-tRNA reductase
MTVVAHLPSWAFELVGISYRTAPLDVLEGLALAPDEVKAFYEQLKGTAGLTSAMVLSTCNRTEIYGLNDGGLPLTPRLTEILREITGPKRFPNAEHLYRAHGRDSMAHLYRVAAGLDSMVLGEAQILGQVKEAYETSCTYLPPAPLFERLIRSVFSAAKRSRNETEIGKGAVSVASAAVHVATRIFHDMGKRTVVVVGAGDTGRLVLEHLQPHTPGRHIIVNRTFERGEALAKSVGGTVWPWKRLAEAIAEADVLVCAVRAPGPIVSRELLVKALEHRTGHPLAILDLGLPRNVAADIDLPNVFLNDLDAFRRVVDANLGRRRKEVPRVEAIIDEEIDKLLDWHRSLQVGPLIAALRDSVEAIRRAEVAKAAAGLNEAERQAVDRATRAVVNKLLHGPTTSIKELAQKSEAGDKLEAVWDFVARLKGGNAGMH